MSFKKVVGWSEIVGGLIFIYLSFARYISSWNLTHMNLTSIEAWVVDTAPLLSLVFLLIGLLFILQGVLNIKKNLS